jgi:hypothetical protein
MKTWLVGVMVVIYGACGDDGAVAIDAPAADTAPPAPSCYLDAVTPAPSCDFSCMTVAWPTTAPDPVVRRGIVYAFFGPEKVGGATVEVHGATDDALLGQTTSSAGPSTLGAYSVSVVTGGVAPRLYAKATKTGLLDGYEYDAYPAFDADHATGHSMQLVADSVLGDLYGSAGVVRDPTRGTLRIQALDCLQHGVAGATATIGDADAVVKYNSGGGAMIPAPFAVATDSSATIWVFNAPVGTQDVVIHAGELTYRASPIGSFANSSTFALRLP